MQASNNIRKLVRKNNHKSVELTKPIIEEWQVRLMEHVMLQMGSPAVFDACQEAVLDEWAIEFNED